MENDVSPKKFLSPLSCRGSQLSEKKEKHEETIGTLKISVRPSVIVGAQMTHQMFLL